MVDYKGPEYDNKLFGFDASCNLIANSAVEKFYAQWMSFDAPAWNGSGLFPDTLSPSELKVAISEFSPP